MKKIRDKKWSYDIPSSGIQCYKEKVLSESQVLGLFELLKTEPDDISLSYRNRERFEFFALWKKACFYAVDGGYSMEIEDASKQCLYCRTFPYVDRELLVTNLDSYLADHEGHGFEQRAFQ